MTDAPNTNGTPAAATGRVHAVILAGGSGQRFWPLSRELSPKQLLSVFGTESLIAQAVHRVMPLLEDPSDGFMIVTSERLYDELRNHLTAQPDRALHTLEYLVEPVARNTAPAIALACARVASRDPEGVVLVLPSDHVLENGPAWLDSLRAAVKLARGGYFATIGIAPTRAETGYGYIRVGDRLPAFDVGAAQPALAAEFVEKPDAETAQRYVAATAGAGGPGAIGAYLWNAGMFAMKASAYLEELRRFPDTAAIADAAVAVSRIQEAAGGPDGATARELFDALPSISIDYAVMERCGCVAVVPAEIRWSDVGSLASLEDLAPADAAGNIRVGRGVDIASTRTVVYSAGDRLVATLGIDDVMVVDTEDATLVARRDAVQDVRLVVEALKAQGADEVVSPKTSLRPWGSWRTIREGEGYRVKEIMVKPGCRLSLQRHSRRNENWIVVEGLALVSVDGAELERGPGQSAYVPLGSAHRLSNPGEGPLRVVEVATGSYLGEDDIERLEDDWSRHG